MLYGKRVLLSLAATSQWMFLEGVLKQAGIDFGRVKIVRDLHVKTMRSLWNAGYGDFFFTEPLAGEGMADGGDSIAFTLAEAAGPVPWSVLYADSALFRRDDRLGQRFYAAIEKAAHWLFRTDLESVGTELNRFFPSASPSQISRAVERFRRTGVWTGTMAIDKAATDRYQQIMVDYGLLSRPEPYPEFAAGQPAHAG
jgi:NitT/TauT family transport system substrate-binding protein